MSQTEIKEIPTTSGQPGQLSDAFDLVTRDPNDVNGHVKLYFDDVLAEPDGYHSGDCVWTSSFKCFVCSRKCLYLFLSYICGIPMAIYWGFQFAFIAFTHVWYITPCLKCFALQCDFLQRFFLACVECSCKPLCSLLATLR